MNETVAILLGYVAGICTALSWVGLWLSRRVEVARCVCGVRLSTCYCGDLICWRCDGPDDGRCPLLPASSEPVL